MSAICAALTDKNVLVQRGALDVVTVLFPFHQSFLLQEDLTCVLMAALHTLLKRDISLSRRLYAWLLGSQVLKSSLVNCMQPPAAVPAPLPPPTAPPSAPGDLSPNLDSDGSQNASDTCSTAYFEKYSKSHLSSALRRVLSHASEAARQGSSKVECVLPYRLLRALLDRPEIVASVLGRVMLDLVTCLRDQIGALGGVSPAANPGKDSLFTSSSSSSFSSKTKGSSLLRDGNASKKPGKKGSLKAEILQSANLMLGSLSPDFVWEWMGSMLEQHLSSVGRCDEGEGHIGGEAGSGVVVSAGVAESSSGGLGREMALPSSSGGEAPEDSEGKTTSKPLDLKTLLGVVMFLLQIMPKVRTFTNYFQNGQFPACRTLWRAFTSITCLGSCFEW